MGHKPFGNYELCVFAQVRRACACRGIDTLNLHGFHFTFGPLFHIDLGYGVEHSCARALTVAVVLFNVSHSGVFADKEAVYALVSAVAVAVVMNAAACNNSDFGTFADVKIVIYSVAHTRFGYDNGNVDIVCL